jgi:hypothetical protein
VGALIYFAGIDQVALSVTLNSEFVGAGALGVPVYGTGRVVREPADWLRTSPVATCFCQSEVHAGEFGRRHALVARGEEWPDRLREWLSVWLRGVVVGAVDLADEHQLSVVVGEPVGDTTRGVVTDRVGPLGHAHDQQAASSLGNTVGAVSVRSVPSGYTICHSGEQHESAIRAASASSSSGNTGVTTIEPSGDVSKDTVLG